jgi:hypothetical protein
VLNQNQINKLMKKVGRKVEEKFDKIEREQKLRQEQQRREREEQLVFITNQIKKIENENPKRGPCVCIWKNMLFGVKATGIEEKENKATATSLPVNDFRDTLDLLETIDDKQFYMFSEALFEETKKSMDWMANHYAQIKIALASIKKVDISAKDKLVQMLSLGTVFEEFQKEFPDKSMYYFKECLLAFENMFRQECFNSKEE